MRLDPAAAAAGFRLATYETLASTNAEALALAARGSHGTTPLWVVAREQTAGRGRRGNEWISPPGNLYATVLLIDPAPPPRTAELAFVAGLAVYDAVVACAASLRRELVLKWPNDVLYRGAKLAGILIESRRIDTAHAAGLAVAIGIGVNCRHHPAHTSYPATDLRSLGTEVSAPELLFALSGAMPRRLALWRRGEGFPGIRADWLDRATGIGGEMRVRLPDRELTGCGETLDEAGRLLLRLPDGSVEIVTAGEVFPLGGRGDDARSGPTPAQRRGG